MVPRKSFSRFGSGLPYPDLLCDVKRSMNEFLQADTDPDKRERLGIQASFLKAFPITFGGLEIHFLHYNLDEPQCPPEQCLEKDLTYSRSLSISVLLAFLEDGEVKDTVEQTIPLPPLPVMTENGSFIINGVEKTVISQIHLSPGVYFTKEDKHGDGRDQYFARIVPAHGAWIDFETGKDDLIYCRIDKSARIPATALLNAFGLSSMEAFRFIYPSEEIFIVGEDVFKGIDPAVTVGQRSSCEVVDPENGEVVLKTGQRITKHVVKRRLKKSGIHRLPATLASIIGAVFSKDVAEPRTGEIIAHFGERLTQELFDLMVLSGIRNFHVFYMDGIGRYLYNSYLKHKRYTYEKDANKYLKRQNKGKDMLETLCGRLYIFKTLHSFERPVVERADACFDKMFLSPFHYDISKAGRIKMNRRFGFNTPVDQGLLTKEDVINVLKHYLLLKASNGDGDDIDHLGHRRVRLPGELLAVQIEAGLNGLRKVASEKMTEYQRMHVREKNGKRKRPMPKKFLPSGSIIKPLYDFFATSPLCQFADTLNPLSGIAQKRRITALGPGGVSRDTAIMEMRDVHETHYGRICPIETPEGKNVGLVVSPALFSRVDEFGFIRTPYRKVKGERVTCDIVYLSACEEEEHTILPASVTDRDGTITGDMMMARKRGEVYLVRADEATLMDISPGQILGVSASLVPFFGHNDGHRVLMAASMQKQSQPLLIPEAPLVGTGLEKQAARDSGSAIFSRSSGMVDYVDSGIVKIRSDNGDTNTYNIPKFRRSNQNSCHNYSPVVTNGERVQKGGVIADGPATKYGELALGRNLLVAYMPWDGYNFEDSILISERLVKEDILTSIDYEEYETDVYETELGHEEITRNVPNRSVRELESLDETGIVRIGTRIKGGNILVGKVSPRGEEDLTGEEKLHAVIFGYKETSVKDSSLVVDHGTEGVVVEIKILDSENGDVLPPGILKRIKVYIADKKKISVGDKLCGRFGNKGVVSTILPEEDMPYMEDGTPVDVVLNPLGVPSRMNIGQLLETHLGMALRTLGDDIRYYLDIDLEPAVLREKIKEMYDDPGIEKDIDRLSDEETLKMAERLTGGLPAATPACDGATDADIKRYLDMAGIPLSGQFTLYDGRTGEPFDNKVTVGVMYILKLCHMVEHKVHARSVPNRGGYSLVTQQPLAGRSKFGGQRLGEMEVWALYAHGAAHTLQEMMTVKSDDVEGRYNAFESIVKGESWEARKETPASFRVLVNELRALGIDVEFLE